MTHAQQTADEGLLQETLLLVKEVKEFGRSLGIEPTNALRQSSNQRPTKSMVWLWLQKNGTIALRTPIDVRIGLSFSAAQEQLPLERLYNIGGYSAYFRQGNQFGDAEAVTTIDFAKTSLYNRVMTILHEDLHGDQNFALTWESEESIITPLSMIAALEFLKQKGEHAHAKEAQAAIEEESRLSKELIELAEKADRLFRTEALVVAKSKLLELVASSGVYGRYYKYQMKNQDENMGLEAKISHDLAYYKYFERIVPLYNKTSDLKMLIQQLKNIPREADMDGVEKYLGDLEKKYRG